METESKPAKLYPDFPLFPHATKRWAKKIRGKMLYFGSWNDPQAALKKYLEQRDDLHAGRVPRVQSGGLAILDLMNRFLAVKEHLVETGELSNRNGQNSKRRHRIALSNESDKGRNFFRATSEK